MAMRRVRLLCTLSEYAKFPSGASAATVWRFEQGERPSALGQKGVISMSALGQKQTFAVQNVMSLCPQ
jgi:hypothetical protein